MSEQEFESQFEDAFEPEIEEEAPSPESAELEPTEQAPETFDIGGRQFTREQLEPVLNFATWANENPERWDTLQRWERGEVDFSAQAPAYEEPALPTYSEPQSEFDPFDEDYLRSLGPQIAEVRQEITQRREAESRAAIDAGIEAFSSNHPDLTKQDMEQVLKWVHDNGTFNSIRPDLPYESRQAAVLQRFEDAYKVNFFDRVRAEQTRQVVDDLNRRTRAAAGASSGVSAPRVRPAPTTPEEKRQAYVDDIAQALAEGN